MFEHEDQSLADAQRAKYRRIAEGAGLAAGMHVLEIGSGWGGFALYAAGELGCRVTSITISREQHDLARERVRAAGLEHLVDIQMRDYRDIAGQYDAVVSIEMLEAVGAEYYTTYFEAVDRALRPGGRFSLQVITFPDVAYETQRRGANWIQTYIFPGGLCPSLAVIEQSLHGTRLLLRDARDIGPHYATTLARLAEPVPREPRRRPRPGLRRPVRPDVGVLPRPVRGRASPRASRRTTRSSWRRPAASTPDGSGPAPRVAAPA